MNAQNAKTGHARPKRRVLRLVLLVVVPLLAAAAGAFIYLTGGRYVETDNAYVKADKIPVSAEVSGAIKEVLVAENQQVQAGQPLFRLDAEPFRVALDKAQAKLAQARTEVASMKASYREKQAEIELARTKQSYALKNQNRQAELVRKNFISASRFDDARESTDVANRQEEALQRDLDRIAESLGGSVSKPVDQHPSYLAALAEVEQARLDLARVIVRAPLAGIVSKPPKPGQYAAAGATAMALVVSGNVWIEANFTETDLTYVHPGQPVKIRVDTYPGKVWQGEVESLSPATGAEFAVIPAQNATGNWVKVTQRVPVRIRLLESPGMPELRAGLSTIVEIDTGHRRSLLGFHL